MDKRHGRILKAHQKAIVSDVNPVPVADKLMQDGIIDNCEAEEIRSECRNASKSGGTRLLLTMLKGPKAFHSFVEALEDHYDWLAKALKKAESDPKYDLKGVDASCAEEPPVKKRKTIDPDLVQDGSDNEDLELKDYHCNNHGYVAIFNFYTDARKSTKTDEKHLEDFFKKELGYDKNEVQVRRDKSKEDFLQELDEVKQKLSKMKKCNLFVCVVLSHGDEKGIKTCKNSKQGDGKHVTIDEITSQFDSINLPELAGTPKVFLIQACRGHEDIQGIKHDEDDDSNQPEEDYIEDESDLREVITPKDADMLIAYATTLGYKSHRRVTPDEGSWFIHFLYKVLMKHHRGKDVLHMLTLVNSKVAERVSSEDAKQMSIHVSTLRKLLFLR